MDTENSSKEYKSLRKAIGPKSNVRELAETCVCFANAQGGEIYIGIEDKQKTAPAPQRILQIDLNKLVRRLRELTDSVGIVASEILTDKTGGEYFILKVLPSTRTIATTSSGKVLIRVSDSCFAVGSDDIMHLAAEKTAFQWEIITVQRIRSEEADIKKVYDFFEDINASNKISDFIKEKTREEILRHYQMVDDDGYLTNLGVLWLGTQTQRAKLSYPLTVQYIVYNDLEEKIRKKEWHYNLQNPKELLLEIEKEAVELTYSHELPDGLFRKNIRQYPPEVIRELLVNAIAHRKYTISGDVFIEVYPNRLVITSPGGLPIGITAENILHERHRRNPHLIQLMSDLKLMEGEGSGYDLVFEMLARDAKPLPQIENDFNKLEVTIYSSSINPEVISIIDYVGRHYNLTQKEYITLGIIASEKKIASIHLAQRLQLKQEDRLRNWIGNLLNKEIIITQGKRKGTQYLLNPRLFKQAEIGIIPSLKTLEPHKLEALICEDLKYNGQSSLRDIKNRLNDANEYDIQRSVYQLVKNGEVEPFGAKKNRTYNLAKKK